MIDEKDINDELPEELMGDIVPEIDPKKLFDEKEYSTIIIGSEGMSKKDVNNADLVTVLISSRSTREEKDEALIQLKENQAQAFIINAITKTKKPDHKALIVASCWETGLDFSKDYLFFIDLICSSDFLVSFEAFTVIQEMETEIDKTTLTQALSKLQKVKDPSVSVTDAIHLIEQQLNTTN
ncbi:MAG: hypothetical protein V4565_10030 [Bacteroidota bacterium]